jgi:hypothetical protein
MSQRADANLDPDDDGFTNLQEFEQNSRPNVADIPPEISLVAQQTEQPLRLRLRSPSQ